MRTRCGAAAVALARLLGRTRDKPRSTRTKARLRHRFSALKHIQPRPFRAPDVLAAIKQDDNHDLGFAPFVHAVTPALGTLELFGDRKPPRCWPARSPCSALGSDSLIEGAGSIIIVWRFSGASHPCRRQHHAGDDGQRTGVARPGLAAGRGRHHLAGQCPLNGDDHELAGRLADGERGTVGCLQHPQHIGHLVAAA